MLRDRESRLGFTERGGQITLVLGPADAPVEAVRVK
jgi:hypothetical protein